MALGYKSTFSTHTPRYTKHTQGHPGIAYKYLLIDGKFIVGETDLTFWYLPRSVHPCHFLSISSLLQEKVSLALCLPRLGAQYLTQQTVSLGLAGPVPLACGRKRPARGSLPPSTPGP